MTTHTAESQNPNTEALLYYCYARKVEITLNDCFSISSDKDDNRKYCKKNKCKSPSHLCLGCVSQDEVEKDSMAIRPGAPLCKRHTLNGYLVRRGDDPDSARREREAKTAEVKRRVQARGIGDGLKKKAIISDEAKDVSEIVEAESEQEEVVEQKLDVTYGKEILKINPTRIRRQPNQIREDFDEEELLELEESIKAFGQVVPGVVKKIEGDPDHDYELAAGERRWICCSRIGCEYEAKLVNVANKAQQYLVSAIENNHRVPNTQLEIAKGIARIKKEMGLSTAEVARKVFGISAGYADQHLAILKLHPDVQGLMNPHRKKYERLQIGTANSLTKFPLDQQLKLANHILDKKMRTDAARRYLKKVATESGIIVKTRKPKPSKSHENFMRFLDMTEDRLKKYLEEMVSREFTEMFKMRSDTHMIVVRRQIDSILKSFEKIQKMT